MTERDIAGNVAILEGAIDLGREPTQEEMQVIASAGLALLRGLLQDLHTIAEAAALVATK